MTHKEKPEVRIKAAILKMLHSNAIRVKTQRSQKVKCLACLMFQAKKHQRFAN